MTETTTTTPWANVTGEQAYQAWNLGELVWTCEMGGIGSDGYEIGIQTVAWELFRAMELQPFDFTTLDAFDSQDKEQAAKAREFQRQYLLGIEKADKVEDAMAAFEPTGAMFGAALNIAFMFHRHGYEKAMGMVPAERRIRISKTELVRQ